jgi:hypothetical protein
MIIAYQWGLLTSSLTRSHCHLVNRCSMLSLFSCSASGASGDVSILYPLGVRPNTAAAALFDVTRVT